MKPIDDGLPGGASGTKTQQPEAASKTQHKRKLIEELRELGSIIGMEQAEIDAATGGLQTSDFWDDVPLLDDMVQASPAEPNQQLDLAPFVKTVERGVESEIVKPLTRGLDEVREATRQSAIANAADADGEESTASAAERAVDLVDTRLREKFGRGLSSDLADEVWQILYDFLESRKS